ncbi:MAG TPA: hypothetical protein VMF89_03310, partial [Polyangiales bacterium]|nr:hypothetical protein [Polyangiales bacterium]
DTHACALLESGRVQCWGGNHAGQLGDGTKENSMKPVDVVELADVAAIDAKASTTCALVSGQGVYCWGMGSLGNGAPPQATFPTPQPVTGIDSAISISVGEAGQACAVHSDHRVLCWGSNVWGQLGIGELGGGGNTPSVVKGVTARLVTLGLQHACAVTTEGAVMCWGRADNGQLGSGSSLESSADALAVVGLSDVVSVSSGSNHSCAARQSSTVQCWGSNHGNALGDGTDKNSTQPVEVAGGVKSVTALSSHGSATCAVRESGELVCWGT